MLNKNKITTEHCQNAELFCTNAVGICMVRCISGTNGCNHVKLYSAADNTNFECAVDNACAHTGTLIKINDNVIFISLQCFIMLYICRILLW